MATTFAECLALAEAGGPRLAPLASVLSNAQRRLDGAMRVAVVGQIKRGKSTLINALLGEEVAATGPMELTYTVNELVYRAEPGVTVRYKSDRPAEICPVSELHRLTARDPDQLAMLADIRTVEYGFPNELLRAFRLIDTPGLASVHQLDSANTAEQLGITAFTTEEEQADLEATLRGLGRGARDLHRDSEHEVARADAVLYLFSRGLHERDQAAVGDFLGDTASVNPLKAFGLLSRCDQYWPPGRELPGSPDPMTYDPMAAATGIAEAYLRRPEIQRTFYTVLPVAGLVGIAGRTLTAEEFGWLSDLSTVEPPLLVRRLSDANRFANRPELAGVELPAPYRRRLVERLGVWGIHLATGYLRAGLTEDEIRDRLVADSGVTRLRELITGHFGNRATLIKLDHAVRDVVAAVGRARLVAQEADRNPPKRLAEIAAAIERLRLREHGFAEFNVLADYYKRNLTLGPDEIADLIAVTGEHGTTCAARLGLPESTPVDELAKTAAARVEAWARRELDPALDRPTARAAATIRRSYERIAYRVHRARLLLSSTDDGPVEESCDG